MEGGGILLVDIPCNFNKSINFSGDNIDFQFDCDVSFNNDVSFNSNVYLNDDLNTYYNITLHNDNQSTLQVDTRSYFNNTVDISNLTVDYDATFNTDTSFNHDIRVQTGDSHLNRIKFNTDGNLNTTTIIDDSSFTMYYSDYTFQNADRQELKFHDRGIDISVNDLSINNVFFLTKNNGMPLLDINNTKINIDSTLDFFDPSMELIKINNGVIDLDEAYISTNTIFRDRLVFETTDYETDVDGIPYYKSRHYNKWSTIFKDATGEEHNPWNFIFNDYNINANDSVSGSQIFNVSDADDIFKTIWRIGDGEENYDYLHLSFILSVDQDVIAVYKISTGSVLDQVAGVPTYRIPKGASVEYRTQDLGSELTKYSNINNTIFQDTEIVTAYNSRVILKCYVKISNTGTLRYAGFPDSGVINNSDIISGPQILLNDTLLWAGINTTVNEGEWTFISVDLTNNIRGDENYLSFKSVADSQGANSNLTFDIKEVSICIDDTPWWLFTCNDLYVNNNLGVLTKPNNDYSVDISGNTYLHSNVDKMIKNASDQAVNIMNDNKYYYTLHVDGSCNFNGNIKIGSNASDDLPFCTVDISANDGIILPRGTIDQRPIIENDANGDKYVGTIRYNTQLNRFEGYGKSLCWNSLGDVMNVDRTTFITAEDIPNATNNQLKFYTNSDISYVITNDVINSSDKEISNNGLRMIIQNTGDVNIKKNVRIGTFDTSYVCALDICNNEFMIIPRGTTEDRNRIPDEFYDAEYYKGAIRYNTTLHRFEGYGAGSFWNSLNSVIDTSRNTYITAEDTPNSHNNQLKFYTNTEYQYDPTELQNTPRMIIEANGDISMNHNLIVKDNVQATDFTAVSDEKLKSNIHNLENPLLKITSTIGRNYTWISDLSNVVQSGVIAQELEPYIPEAVQNKQHFKTVNYNAIIPYLIESIKEQQQQISNLEKRIVELENK